MSDCYPCWAVGYRSCHCPKVGDVTLAETPLTAERAVAAQAAGAWQAIATAPKDRFILVKCPSGYTTTPFVYTTAIMRSTYHIGRWIDHANDDLTDWGMEPTHWMPLPEAQSTLEHSSSNSDAFQRSIGEKA